MVALLFLLVVVGLSLGTLQAQTATFNDTTITALGMPIAARRCTRTVIWTATLFDGVLFATVDTSINVLRRSPYHYCLALLEELVALQTSRQVHCVECYFARRWSYRSGSVSYCLSKFSIPF